ncbi:hypothetical protein H0A66_03980 [Alcaligenaceae bacterium]|nr:hypothetical protein [Alcaligenaceae bacterium]
MLVDDQQWNDKGIFADALVVLCKGFTPSLCQITRLAALIRSTKINSEYKPIQRNQPHSQLTKSEKLNSLKKGTKHHVSY